MSSKNNELKSINEMTLAELEQLQNNVHIAVEQKRELAQEERKKKFFDDNGTGIREKIDELRKEYVELCKAKHKATISAEVSFTLSGRDFDNLFSEYCGEHEISDIFDLELKAEFLNKKDFDSTIVEEVESRLDDVASDACFEAAKLKPNLHGYLEDFTDEVNKILSDFEEFEISGEERAKLLKPIRAAKKTVKKTAKKGKK